MRGIVAWILGIGLAVNGLIMFAVPAAWYAAVPGVTASGPFNAHFIRDIGVAYLVAGMALPWFALYKVVRPAALAGVAFLILHAVVHLWDAATGREDTYQLLVDVPLIVLPALLALWVAWPSTAASSKQGERQ